MMYNVMGTKVPRRLVMCVIRVAVCGLAVAMIAPMSMGLNHQRGHGFECAASSWSPEKFTFFGDAAIVTQKLGGFDLDLKHRRVFIVAIESPTGDRVTFYEQEGSGYRVKSFAGEKVPELLASIDKEIMANHGVNCVGEQSKALFSKAGGSSISDMGIASPPASTKAVLNHLLSGHKGEFVETTVYLMC